MRLPLAQRELARMGKSRRVYIWRTVLIGSFALLVLILWLVSTAPSGTAPSVNPEHFGGILAGWCFRAELILLLVVMPVLTAPLIASERNQHSLALLLLADFRGWDIFAAKFVSAFLEAGLLLVSLTPLQLLTTYFGGLSPDAALAQMAVFSTMIVYTCCVGLLCSTLSRNTVTAAILTVAAILATALAFLAIDFVAFTRAWTWDTGFHDALFLVLLPGNGPTVAPYGRFIIVLLVASAMVAAACVAILPHLAFARPRRYWVGAPTPYGHTVRRLLRWGPVWPLLSIHATGLTSTLRSNPARTSVLILLAIIGAVPFLGTMIIIILMAQEVTASLTGAIRSGAIDDLRLTVIDNTRLARDILLFYWRRILLYAPAMMIAALYFGLYAAGLIGGDPSDLLGLIGRSPLYGLLYTTIVAAGIALLGFAQLYAAVATGTFVGASGNSPSLQAAVTLVVLALPYALCLSVAHSAAWYLELYQRVEAEAWKAWLYVPLCLAISTAVFGALGVAAHREFWRTLERGWTTGESHGTWAKLLSHRMHVARG